MSLLVKNGIVVTMNTAKDVLWDAAVYCDGGSVVEVGDAVALSAKYEQKATKVVDAAGKVVYPGFVNLHTHGVLTILRGQAEDEHTFTAVYEKMFPIGEIMTDEDCYHLAKLAFLELLKFGSTTVVDNWGSMHEVARAAYEVGVRAYLNDTIRDADALKIKDGVYEYHPEIGERTLKASVDLVDRWHMKDDGRIQVVMGPHATDTCSPQLLKKVREIADKHKLKITTHLGQNRTEVRQVKERYGMSPCRYLESTGILGPDFIGAHGIFLTSEDIDLLAKTKSSLSHNSVINANRGYIAPVAAMLKAGVNVGLGTDNMAADLIEVMRVGLMVSRIKTGIPYEPKPYEMLEMATLNGAKALGVQDQQGSIEAGKLADLVIVDYRKPHYIPVLQPNVVANLVHTGLSSDIDTVVVAGRVLVEAGCYVAGNEQEIMENAQATAESVWQKWQERR